MNLRLINSMFRCICLWTYTRSMIKDCYELILSFLRADEIKEQMKNIPYISRWMAKCTLKIPSKWIPYSDSFFKANSKQRAIFWEAAVCSLVVVVAAYKVTGPAHTLLCCWMNKPVNSSLHMKKKEFSYYCKIGSRARQFSFTIFSVCSSRRNSW